MNFLPFISNLTSLCLKKRIAPATLLVLLTMLSLVIVLTGCRESRTRRTLRLAEAVMEESPDSSYRLLSELRIDSTSDKSDRALYALLLTQAMHKTDILVPANMQARALADSMMREAVNYYEESINREKLMLSLYYYGIVKSMDDKYEGAVTPLSESLVLAETLDDDYWIARNYETLGDICSFAGLYTAQEEMQRNALLHYEKTDKANFIKFARLGLAIATMNSENFSGAISLVREIQEKYYPHISPENDPEIWQVCHVILAKSFFFQNRFKESVQEIEKIDSGGMHRSNMDVFHIVGYIHIGDLRQAQILENEYNAELEEDDKLIIKNAFCRRNGDLRGELSTM